MVTDIQALNIEQPDLKEVEQKESRIKQYLQQNGYEAAVLGRQDNFSWLTGGGHNRVMINSLAGVCFLVLTLSGEKYVVANTMDGQRLLDEEMQGMDYELINLKWFEQAPENKVLELIEDKKAVADIALEGIDCKPAVFTDLHYPLTDNEVKKYRWLGEEVEEILMEAAAEVEPGLTEKEVETLLRKKFAEKDMLGIVVLIGSDDRIKKYRHPVPTSKKIENTVMLAPAVQKWGLTVPVTRMIYWGSSLPRELKDKYQALCEIEASTLASCQPGRKFNDILKMQKKMYRDLGYPREWKEHFMGGITGYIVNDPSRCTDPEAQIKNRQTFNWYLTITGAKVEETTLSRKSGPEILTATGLWPRQEYEVEDFKFKLPQILKK